METLAQLWIIGFVVFWTLVISTAVVLRIRTKIRSRRAMQRAQQHLRNLPYIRVRRSN